MDEFTLIKQYLTPLAAGFPGSLNLTDDAALIDVPAGKQLIITKDTISEGIHFLGTEEASLVAKKLLRVNLSDLAAKGATPLCYLIAASLPESTDERWVEGFAEGLKQDQQEFSIHLAGGDTTKTLGTLSLSLTALGLIDAGKMLKRSGAKIGDDIYVSGTLGDAALGLMSLNGELNPNFERDDELEQRYFLPQPRVALGQKLVGIAHSCMDISDGLVQDLGHICKTSNAGATIHLSSLPLSHSAMNLVSRYPELWKRIITGGDDYELLFTAPASAEKTIAALSQEGNVPITKVGMITKGSNVEVLDESKTPIVLKKAGYRHF
jgi:thiamine-monophosphate kinase